MASSKRTVTTTTHSSLSSLSTHSSASASATFTPVISHEYNPFVYHYDDKNGTVFIAVGTIIVTLFVLLLSARFWYWLKNRKAAQDATRFDDYYGGGTVSYYDDDKSDLSFLTYDPTSFMEKKNSYRNENATPNSGSSGFTHNSTASSSSFGSMNDNQSRVDLSNLTSQPGHNLRSALAQSYIPPRNRHSFISPINQLIQEQNPSMQSVITDSSGSKRLSSNQLLDAFNIPSPVDPSVNISSPPTSATSKDSRRRKTQSISLLINSSSPNMNSKSNLPVSNNHSTNTLGGAHSRSTSLDLHELEKMIHRSLAENKSKDSVESASPASVPSPMPSSNREENKKRTRPPSLVLDMLVQNEMNL